VSIIHATIIRVFCSFIFFSVIKSRLYNQTICQRQTIITENKQLLDKPKE